MTLESGRYVYIMASTSRVLYTGSTPDLHRRVFEHRTGVFPGFTKRYNVTRLVHYEWTDHVRSALQREREIKSWRRAKKIVLIEAHNPGWLDLAVDWHPEISRQGPSLRSG